MRKLLILTIASMLLTSCNPSKDELAAKYSASPDGFEELRKMIIEDTGQKVCFVVGLDNIGEYWEYKGKWTSSNDYKTNSSLSEVLKKVALSEERYEKYKKLFAKTGSERVSFCHTIKHAPQQVTVLVFRTGLAISGCIGNINWRDEPPLSTGKRGKGNYTEITPLSKGWYLKYTCN